MQFFSRLGHFPQLPLSCFISKNGSMAENFSAGFTKGSFFEGERKNCILSLLCRLQSKQNIYILDKKRLLDLQ
jgi:hypothetical protein